MNRSIVLFVFLLLSCGVNAQNTLAGLVKLQSSGKTPLPNVEVYALGAQTTYTNDKGYFELHFNNKGIGDLISTIEFSLEGYVLINEEKAQGLTIPKDPTLAPIQIVMSPRDVYREQRARYYGIIVENASELYRQQNTQLQRQLKDLEDKLEQLQGASRERQDFEKERRILLQQIDNLHGEKEQLIANADRYAQLFARIDVDGASQMAGKALQLFEAGKIADAIKLMDDAQLDQNMRDAKAAKAEAERLSQRADSMLQQSVANYMLKARLCIIDRQYEAAVKNYEYAIDGDSTHVGNLEELGHLYSQLNQQKHAMAIFQQALRHNKDEFKRAVLLNELGNEFRNNNQYQDAEEALVTALAIIRKIHEIAPGKYDVELATVQHNLGYLYSDQNDFERAEAAYLEAREIRKKLLTHEPAIYKARYALTLNNMGIMYASQNAYEQAMNAYNEALSIYRELAEADTVFVAELAMVQTNLGRIYANSDDYQKADAAYREALQTYLLLAEKSPEIYKSDVAMAQLNLATIYMEQNAFNQAEPAYQEALAIYQQLAEANPERFEPELANVLLNLGLMHLSLSAFDEAEASLNQALHLYQRLAIANPQRFDSEVAKLHNNLGNLYLELQNYEQADTCFRQAAEVYERLVAGNPDRFEPEMATVYTNLGNLYANRFEFERAEAAYLKTLAIRRRLAADNPERFEPDLARTQSNLGNLYARMADAGGTEADYDRSESANLEALKVNRRLSQRQPDKYNLQTARNALLLAVTKYYRNKKEEALELFREAIALSDQYPDVPIAVTMSGAIAGFPGMEAADPEYYEWFQQVAPIAERVKGETSDKAKAQPQGELVAVWEQAYTQFPTNPRIRTALGLESGHWAWYLIHEKDFVGAETAARRALEIYPFTADINAILAPVLLLRGKYMEAESIYLLMKDQLIIGQQKTWGQSFLEDLDELESAGITHPDMEKIRALLKE